MATLHALMRASPSPLRLPPSVVAGLAVRGTKTDGVVGAGAGAGASAPLTSPPVAPPLAAPSASAAPPDLWAACPSCLPPLGAAAAVTSRGADAARPAARVPGPPSSAFFGRASAATFPAWAVRPGWAPTLPLPLPPTSRPTPPLLPMAGRDASPRPSSSCAAYLPAPLLLERPCPPADAPAAVSGAATTTAAVASAAAPRSGGACGALRPPPANVRPLPPVFIDGSNVGYEHGGHTHFSLPGVYAAARHYGDAGHPVVLVVLPHFRWAAALRARHVPLAAELLARGWLLFCGPDEYDDLVLLVAAVAAGGVVVSNDRFRAEVAEQAEVTSRWALRAFLGRRRVAFAFDERDRFVPRPAVGRML